MLCLYLLLPDSPSLALVPFPTFLTSAVTPGYVLTPEDLELGASDEREHVALDCLIQYDLLQSHPFICKVHDLIFLYSRIVLQDVFMFSLFIHGLKDT